MGIYDEKELEPDAPKPKKKAPRKKKTKRPVPAAVEVSPKKKKKAPAKRTKKPDKKMQAALDEIERLKGLIDNKPQVKKEVEKVPKLTPEEFFSSIEPTPDYIKHLIRCRCILPQFLKMEEPPDHQFVVFSTLNDKGGIKPHYAQCNNCGLIHKIHEVGLSQTISKESLMTLPTTTDIEGAIPKWLSKFLEENECDLHVWQEAEFIYTNELWGRFVVLAKEHDEDMVLGKVLQILGKELFKVEAFERDETDVRPD